MNIVLCGFQGSGKTTHGRAAAALLNRPFFDVDRCLLEKFAANSISELFVGIGEEKFRASETVTVKRLAEERDAVIALGGGSLTDVALAKEVRAKCTLLYLYFPLSEVHRRVHRQKTCYLAGKDMTQCIHDRHATFLSHCTMLLPCHQISKDEIIERICSYGK